MNALLNYLLEASLALTACYGVYYWLLRTETNFHFVRGYLLLALLASALLPLIDLSASDRTSGLPVLSDAISTYWLPEIKVGNALVENELSISFWQGFLVLYSIGIGVLLLRLLLQIKQLFTYLKHANRSIINNTVVVEVAADKPTFSFFGFIVIGQVHLLSEEDKQAIIQHEQVHAGRYHSFDMLLVNLLGILFWFNPIIYFYKKALVQVHEFEADSRAVTNHDVDQYCGLLAKVALHSAEFPIANHFNNSLTLKRIAMLKTIKHTMATWKKVMLLPAAALIFLVIACEDQITNLQTATENSVVVTHYPAVVQKELEMHKAKNPSATFEVIGVRAEGEAAFDAIMMQSPLKEGEIVNLYIIPSKDEKDPFKTYGIIEKGEKLSQALEFTTAEDGVHTIVDESAQPVGGMPVLYEMIGANLRYPEEAKKQGVQGKVFIEFIVNEDGSLSNLTVLKGIGSGCDEAAMETLRKSPNWIPGKQNGKVVKQRMVLSINFSIG